MSKVKIHNFKGEAVGDQELIADVFEVKLNDNLVHQVVVAQQANSRQVVAHTKIRSEVRGGGRKPWKQKGTGRARHGSSRSPIWRGGGVTFGPRNDRNFTKQVNRKMKNKALLMVLSDKVAHDHLVVLDSMKLADAKTSTLKAGLAKLPVGESKVLVVMGEKNEDVIKAANNLPQVGYLAADSLNVVDILKYDYMLVDQAGLEKIVNVYNR